MRHRSRVPLAGAAVVAALLVSTAPTHAGGGLGAAQWHPYPFFGLPGFPHDHVVSLRLQVTPREAMVYVDGFVAGPVDEYDGVFQRLRLIPGPHEIVIYHPGYRTFRQQQYFNPGSSHTIRYRLEPLLPGEAPEPQPAPRQLPPGSGVPPSGAIPDPSRVGTLVLRVQPADATVLVDGEEWKGPPSRDRLVLYLAEGPHRVRVEKPGFQPFDVEVDVRAGDTTSFNVSLVP